MICAVVFQYAKVFIVICGHDRCHVYTSYYLALDYYRNAKFDIYIVIKKMTNVLTTYLQNVRNFFQEC